MTLLEAAKEILFWVQPCEYCEGNGTEPDDPRSACHKCGGYGEEVHGDIMEAILSLREAVMDEEEK